MAEAIITPSQTPTRGEPSPPPFILVIFGASGDLTHRKLVPAVYNLFREKLLPENYAVIGFSRTPMSHEQFRTSLAEALAGHRPESFDEAHWQPFAEHVFYHSGNASEQESMDALRQFVEKLAADRSIPANCLFYFATQPQLFGTIVQRITQAGLTRRGASQPPWSRFIIEKPFGRDIHTARQLNDQLRGAVDESQVFRIDHYLGKEAVQNLLVFRFANSLFEPLWNHKYIDHVQIAVSETVGVAGRGAFYEQAGALRDMVQSHMMHLLSLVAMESPVRLEADAIRDEKVKVLKALRPIPRQCVPDCMVRGQYTAGTSTGEPTPGYRQEQGVAPDSRTETYAALQVFIDNWRWSGVPFYLRTGKRMPVRITEIGIHFRPVPNVLFNVDPTRPMAPNVLAIRIQPREGMSLQFQVKAPGPATRIKTYKMDFCYAEAFGREPPEAYERLLLDAALGDSTLFARCDEVDAGWAFLQPVLDACQECCPTRLPQYPAGTWGPVEADQLIARDGRQWTLTKRPDKTGQGSSA